MRKGNTRSHSELGSQAFLRRWYFTLRYGRVGRCRHNILTKICYYEDKKFLKINKKKREEIYEYFRLNKGFEYNYQIIFGKKKFIERFNIHNVVLQSMKQSIILLSKKSDTIIIDGKFIPSEMKGYKVKSLIKADDKINQVSAASIIAKVFRDKLLLKLHSLDGNYQWNKNAGYGTKSHLSAIYTHGVSKYHRTTYQPISKLIKKLST